MWVVSVFPVLFFLLAIGAAFGRSGIPPNVIVVMADDQGYGEVGAHGNPLLLTPNLDRLHASSLRLTDFHVDPTCSPTRSALMTGRHSRRAGVWHTISGRSLLRGEETTLAEVFAAHGYRTGIFGKWHLGDNHPLRPQDQGFQEVLVHGGGGVGQGPDYWGNDYFDDVYFHNGRPEPRKGYCTQAWFDAALEFITANRARPFFAYLPTNAAHAPYRVDAKYSAPYQGKGVNAAFYGMIANLDEHLGRLMDSLRTLGLEENTLLLFLTDNGSSDPAFNAGMRGAKGTLYEGGHRVPCFLRWPAGGLQGGKDLSLLAAHFDLMPTVLSLCGLPRPPGVRLDGMDLSPWMKGDRADAPPRTLVVESQRRELPAKSDGFAVLSPPWRLVGNALYDLRTDPGQAANVASRFPDTVQRLTQAYHAWWSDVSGRDAEQVAIALGAPSVDSVRLMSHDWHPTAGETPWDQGQIREGTRSNGYWAVDFVRGGRYRVSLRRWPDEAQGLPSLAIPAKTARLRIGDREKSLPVPAGAAEVSFLVDSLPAGPTRLQTWLTDAGGASWGAYYVKVITVAAATGLAEGRTRGERRVVAPAHQAGKRVFPGRGTDLRDALGKAWEERNLR